MVEKASNTISAASVSCQLDSCMVVGFFFGCTLTKKGTVNLERALKNSSRNGELAGGKGIFRERSLFKEMPPS